MNDNNQTITATDKQGTATSWQIFCWCLFDWAHSAFPIIIITFVFSNYFIRSVAHSVTTGTAYWAWAIGTAGVFIALLSPICGTIADYTGHRKRWLAILSLICIIATALLWFVQADSKWIIWALVFVTISQTSFELIQIFYNAIMVDIAPKDKIGRISGWGWGLGYIGGIVCLAIALVVFVNILPKSADINVRSTTLLVAIWFAIFALPLLIFTPEYSSKKMAISDACRKGLSELWQTITHAKQYKGILLFLIAHLIYIDGLNTLFAVGGTFAGGTFNMSFSQILIFAITLNISAGIGAISFAWLDDYLGSKLTIALSIVGLILSVSLILFAYSLTWFWLFSFALGLFVGPTQAASRSYMAHISPQNLLTQMFGLYNFSGRISSFIGPFIFGILTEAFHSQRAGMSSVVVMMIVGLTLLIAAPNAKAKPAAKG